MRILRMKTRVMFVLLLMCLYSKLAAQPQQPDEPRYTSDGQLLRPENYREWIYLSTGLGMTYSAAGAAANALSERFDNVFVTPQAYKAFLGTGTWPDKTVFVLELRSSASTGSINKGGHYQEEVIVFHVHLKDD